MLFVNWFNVLSLKKESFILFLWFQRYRSLKIEGFHNIHKKGETLWWCQKGRGGPIWMGNGNLAFFKWFQQLHQIWTWQENVCVNFALFCIRSYWGRMSKMLKITISLAFKCLKLAKPYLRKSFIKLDSVSSMH